MKHQNGFVQKTASMQSTIYVALKRIKEGMDRSRNGRLPIQQPLKSTTRSNAEFNAMQNTERNLLLAEKALKTQDQLYAFF